MHIGSPSTDPITYRDRLYRFEMEQGSKRLLAAIIAEYGDRTVRVREAA